MRSTSTCRAVDGHARTGVVAPAVHLVALGFGERSARTQLAFGARLERHAVGIGPFEDPDLASGPERVGGKVCGSQVALPAEEPAVHALALDHRVELQLRAQST